MFLDYVLPLDGFSRIENIKPHFLYVLHHLDLCLQLAPTWHHLPYTLRRRKQVQADPTNALVLGTGLKQLLEGVERRHSAGKLVDAPNLDRIKLIGKYQLFEVINQQCFKVYVEFHRVIFAALKSRFVSETSHLIEKGLFGKRGWEREQLLDWDVTRFGTSLGGFQVNFFFEIFQVVVVGTLEAQGLPHLNKEGVLRVFIPLNGESMVFTIREDRVLLKVFVFKILVHFFNHYKRRLSVNSL